MRPFLTALVLAALAATLHAASPAIDDAPLRAVQFLDKDEGWVVGDDGLVLQTIDGGKSWERRSVGTRASLRSVHFLNPLVGWIAGREELPHGGSVGVVVVTVDGGVKWKRQTFNALPGLQRVRFLDTNTGFVVGDAVEQYPSGVFATRDGGRTWLPMAGPRGPGWLTAEFLDEKTGALGGPWNRLAMYRGEVSKADVDLLGGRSVFGMHLAGRRCFAVGQGGLILTNDNVADNKWGILDGGLPMALRASWDFQAIHAVGSHVWAVGRPGSAVLHSANGGTRWEILRTGQPLPLHGVHFVDDKAGWAVGELGTILATTDGGKSWKAQRRGGQRSAILMIHARPLGLPLETVAVLGGDEGYLTAALRVPTSDPLSAPFSKANESQRWTAAMRQVGGTSGETLWQFPIPQHLGRTEKEELLSSWDKLHGGKASEQLLRQLVLAVRTWRPAVVVTDNPDLQITRSPVEAVLAEAVHEAFQQAADPKAFPEQIEMMGLEPWQAQKLYGCWASKDGANVAVDAAEPNARLAATPRDLATSALALLTDTPVMSPAQRYFKLLASRVEGAAQHRGLMDGIPLAAGGLARRELKPVETPDEILQAVRQRRNLQALAEAPPDALIEPARVMALVKPSLAKLPADQAAPAVFAIGSHYARMGQWHLTREIFLELVDQHPAHPLAAEAYRWLIKHGGSSEARRRHELGQFLVYSKTEFQGLKNDEVKPASNQEPKDEPPNKVVRTDYQGKVNKTGELVLLGDKAETRRWFQSCLEIEPRLAGFGPLYAEDPATQLVLQAARRQLGDFDSARKWYTRFAHEQPDGPRRAAAASELWLVNRTGQPAKPVAACWGTGQRPFLDGKLDEDVWQAHKPLVLRDAVGETAKANKTEVWLAFDKDFLYVAARCARSEGKKVEPVKVRPRDADLRAFDRISLVLDLDRDYATYFHLQADQRGCVCEDCWGDLTWNPKWFVAVEPDDAGWTLEAAIPLIELSGDGVTTGKTWAANVARVLPGQGVQALSLPADASPRPEGLGLMMFTQDPKPNKPGEKPAAPMSKVP